MISPKVYILILNWNGWKDTIECLESVFRSSHIPFVVVVCDNGSQDDSLHFIKSWAAGQLNVFVPGVNPHRHLSHPPVSKPIPHIEYHREIAEQGGSAGDEVPLILIQTGSNLGFAGGNNVGLRYILAQPGAQYVWLLNNDTVIRHDALGLLVAKGQSEARIGSVGSTVLYYDRPEVLDAAGGGMISKYLGGVVHIMHGRLFKDLNDNNVPLSLDYVTGASCFLPISVIKKVGLLDETFYHFWEDADLGFRIIKRGYRNVYESRSIIYHKVGASTGGKSALSDYYELRNSIIFYRKHFGSGFLCIIVLKLVLKTVNRIRRRQLDRIPLFLKAFRHGFRTLIKSNSH